MRYIAFFHSRFNALFFLSDSTTPYSAHSLTYACEDWPETNDLYGRLMVIIKSFSWQFKRLIKRFLKMIRLQTRAIKSTESRELKIWNVFFIFSGSDWQSSSLHSKKERRDVLCPHEWDTVESRKSQKIRFEWAFNVLVSPGLACWGVKRFVVSPVYRRACFLSENCFLSPRPMCPHIGAFALINGSSEN